MNDTTCGNQIILSLEKDNYFKYAKLADYRICITSIQNKYIETIQAIDKSKLFDFYDHKTNITSPLTYRKPFLSFLQYWLLFALNLFFVSTKQIAQNVFYCFLFNFELL